MYLKHLTVQRFKGLKDATFEFTPGLNVIYGPNEAGKSTLQDAICALFFSDVKSAKAETLRAWGSDDLPSLTGMFETDTGEVTVTKDFTTGKAQFITSTGSKISDVRKVKDEIASFIGVSDEEVYKATACLPQQDWAQVSSGAKLHQLLQDSLSGSVKGSVEDILRKLDKALTEMRRGTVRMADKNPGPLAIALQEHSRISENLTLAGSDAQEGDIAREQIQTAHTRLNEITAELQEAEALKLRCEERLKTENDFKETETLAQNLQIRTRRISDLQGTINLTQSQLEQLPEIPEQVIIDLNRHIERQKDEHQLIEKKNSRLVELRDDITRLTDSTGHAEDIEQLRAQYNKASELRNNIEIMTRQAVSSHEIAQQLQQQAEALQRRAKPVTGLAITGVLLLIAGIVLGLNNPALFSICAIGLIPLGIAFSLRPIGLQDLLERLQAQQQTVANEQAEVGKLTQALADIFTATNTGDIGELSGVINQRQEETANLSATLQARQEDLTRLQEDIQQSEALIKKLQETVQEKLGANGVTTPEQLQEKFNQRKKTENDNRDAQNTLTGLLGQESIDDIRDAHSRAAIRLLALEEKLATPELAMAKTTPEAYQKLIDRLVALRDEQVTLRNQLHEAQISLAARHHDSDDVKRLDGQREDASRRVEMLQERLAAWELVQQAITSARDNTMRDVTSGIAPQMTKLLTQMTGGRYTKAHLKEDLTPVIVMPEASFLSEVEPGVLSCATQEQVFLAARLAIIDMLWPQGGPPVLMDDPLVNFDATRREATVLALQEFTQKHQVILFTCHDDYRSFASQYIEMPQPV